MPVVEPWKTDPSIIKLSPVSQKEQEPHKKLFSCVKLLLFCCKNTRFNPDVIPAQAVQMFRVREQVS